MARRVTIKVIIEDIDEEEIIAQIKKIKEALADLERFTVELSSIR